MSGDVSLVDAEAFMSISLSRHQRDDKSVTLAPDGEVDLCVVDALISAIQSTTGTGRVDVVVDLARVTFLDCAGVGALVVGRNTARSTGCGYTVVNPQPQVRRVLELTGVLTALTVPLQPDAATDRAARSRRSGRRMDGRRGAVRSTAPSVAGVFGSGLERSR
jgi:anti-anti-sigma factor